MGHEAWMHTRDPRLAGRPAIRREFRASTECTEGIARRRVSSLTSSSRCVSPIELLRGVCVRVIQLRRAGFNLRARHP